MNDTPIADGGGTSSGLGALVGGVKKAMEADGIYVETEELEAFAKAMADHEVVLNQALKVFAGGQIEVQRGESLVQAQFTTYDAHTLQLGGLSEAVGCTESFQQVTFRGCAESTYRVGSGQSVCGEVIQRTRDNYLNDDEQISIDNESLEREIDQAGSDNRGLLLDSDTSWEGGSVDE